MALLVAACGKSEATKQAEQVAQATSDMAKAGEQMANDLAAGKSVGGPVVSPEKLVAFLPQLTGWTKGEPQTDTVTVGMSVSTAKVEYSKGDDNLRIEIIDTSMNQMVLMPFMMLAKSGYSETTSTGYTKAVVIAGLPAAEQWDSENKSADVTAIVGGRFVVKASTSGLSDASVARKAIEAVDGRGLAALK